MSEKEKVKINRQHKDRLFNFIFGSEENKKWTLSLYNAVNGSNYEDESLIVFNTLQNYLYVSMKNDTSFIITDTMSLYEHQSTFNPNMPLRMLRYLSNLYSKYVKENALDVFGKDIIELPVPKLVTFYNGLDDVEDEIILKLSDSFPECQKENGDVEVKVRMLNINYGHNKRLIQGCSPLKEYSWLIDRIRKYNAELGIEKATIKAIREMPSSFEIKIFLVSHMSEVADMMLAEDQEINALELVGNAREKRGIEKGIEKGIEQGLKQGIEDKLEDGISTDIIKRKLCKRFEISEERANEYVNKVLSKTK